MTRESTFVLARPGLLSIHIMLVVPQPGARSALRRFCICAVCARYWGVTSAERVATSTSTSTSGVILARGSITAWHVDVGGYGRDVQPKPRSALSSPFLRSLRTSIPGGDQPVFLLSFALMNHPWSPTSPPYLSSCSQLEPHPHSRPRVSVFFFNFEKRVDEFVRCRCARDPVLLLKDVWLVVFCVEGKGQVWALWALRFVVQKSSSRIICSR